MLDCHGANFAFLGSPEADPLRELIGSGRGIIAKSKIIDGVLIDQGGEVPMKFMESKMAIAEEVSELGVGFKGLGEQWVVRGMLDLEDEDAPIDLLLGGIGCAILKVVDGAVGGHGHEGLESEVALVDGQGGYVDQIKDIIKVLRVVG